MASPSSNSHLDQKIDIIDRRIELIPRKRRLLRSSTLVYEYVPPKESTQLYEDCIKSVELEFGKDSKKFRVLRKLIQDCKEQRVSIREIESTTDELFKNHVKLYKNFCNAVLPCLYPVSTRDQVDRANQFLRSVESAFPNNQKRCDFVENLILKFQDGTLSLKDMTVKMLKLMENRHDLIEAYIKFVPQAEHVIASIQIKRRFIFYLAMIAIILAFGIGVYTMKK